jgi:mannose-6-phosphate isomerase
MRVDQPLRLEPRLVRKPWGGRRLADWGRTLPDDGTWGESWDVSDLDPVATDLPNPSSRVAAGPHRGRHLHELVAGARDDLLGDSHSMDGRFPLLVKTLDAREHLSVQVHPSRRYVAQDDSVNLKTESWVVVAAEPGAGMWLGLDHDVTLEQVRVAAGSPGLTEMLRWVPAEPGAVHHLPAGLVHALGAGVMVAEVQTPSDTTFRLYDWTREYDREDRPLHVHEGLHALELEWELNLDPARAIPEPDGATIVTTDHYRIDRHHLDAGTSRDSEGGRARVLMALSGTVHAAGDDDPLPGGGVLVLPAAWSGPVRTTAGATILEVIAT